MATKKVGLYRNRGKWSVRWFTEVDPDTGVSKRLGKDFRLKREAEEFRAMKQAEFDQGAKREPPPDIAISAFYKKYLARRSHEWRPKTREQIENLCGRLIKFFGKDALLRAITPDQASKFWSEARPLRPELSGTELSRYSRNRILRDAKTMFKFAVRNGFLTSNPFDGIKGLRVGKKVRNFHYVQPDEYLKILRAAPDLRWKIIYALAYTSALRSGELFNLTEDNIDLKSGRVIVKSREGTDALPPFFIKDHEDREVPLPRHTVKLLAGWLRVRPPDSPLILLTPERYQRVLARWQEHRAAGKPWVNDYLVNNTLLSLRRHAKWAGFELDGALTMHGFRKSCGQNWANHLPMNVVKELMGHADIATTAKFYSAVSKEHEAHAQWITEAITVGRGREDRKVKPREFGGDRQHQEPRTRSA